MGDIILLGVQLLELGFIAQSLWHFIVMILVALGLYRKAAVKQPKEPWPSVLLTETFNTWV
jgi:hypothetical protein